jgi:hypothetical protein
MHNACGGGIGYFHGVNWLLAKLLAAHRQLRNSRDFRKIG